MALETVGPLESLPEDAGFLFRTGAHQIALFRVGDDVRAIDNQCPHAGASLSDGPTDGVSVACPWHCWEFDVTTGKCLTVEDMDVDIYPVVVENGVVKVEVTD